MNTWIERWWFKEGPCTSEIPWQMELGLGQWYGTFNLCIIFYMPHNNITQLGKITAFLDLICSFMYIYMYIYIITAYSVHYFQYMYRRWRPPVSLKRNHVFLSQHLDILVVYIKRLTVYFHKNFHKNLDRTTQFQVWFPALKLLV